MLRKWGGPEGTGLWGHTIVKYTLYCSVTQAAVTHPSSCSSKHYQFHRIINKGIFICLFFFSHCSRVAEDHDRSPKHVGNDCQCGNYPRVKDVCCSCWRFGSGAGSPGWPKRRLCESCGGDAGPQAGTSQRKGENWRPWGQVTVSVFLTLVLISACYLCLSDWTRLKLGQASWWISYSIYIPSLSVLWVFF